MYDLAGEHELNLEALRPKLRGISPVLYCLTNAPEHYGDTEYWVVSPDCSVTV